MESPCQPGPRDKKVVALQPGKALGMTLNLMPSAKDFVQSPSDYLPEPNTLTMLGKEGTDGGLGLQGKHHS